MQENESGCTGCGSSSTVELDEEALNVKMEETKKTIEQMVDSLNGFNINTEYFESLEKKLESVTSYLQSGDFLNSIKGAAENSRQKQEDLMSRMYGNSPKTPVGWVYVDENGQQQFSPTEPQGVTSTPVYA